MLEIDLNSLRTNKAYSWILGMGIQEIINKVSHTKCICSIFFWHFAFWVY